jgi:Tfp pilus assembly protein PilN
MVHRSLALPAPDQGWVLYSSGSETARGNDLRSLVGSRSDILVGLPAAVVSTFVVELPLVDAALLDSMIHAQIEKRGLGGKAGSVYDFERLERNERSETFAVRVVTELPESLVVPTAAGYTLSAALEEPSAGSAVLRREQGRLVLSIRVGETPAHIQVLSGRPGIGAAAAKEINLLLLGLRAESVFEAHPPRELILAAEDADEAAIAAFREALSIPVRRQQGPVIAARGEARERLLPPAVARSRKRRRAIRRNTTLLVAGLILYAVIGVWAWNDARVTRGEIASLERRLSIIEPDVERVRSAEERWLALEAAFDKKFFPVVQLSRITAALPGSGVVIRDYRTAGKTIRIEGQARDVQLANRLLEDLQNTGGFELYDWSMPNPKVEKNNTATFVIEGKPKNASADT